MLVVAGVMLVLTNPYYLLRPTAVLDNFRRHVWVGASFGFYLKAWAFGFGLLPLAAALGGLAAAAVKRNRPALAVGLWGLAYYVLVSIFGKQFARFLLPAFPAAAMMGGFVLHVAFAAPGRTSRAPLTSPDASAASGGADVPRPFGARSAAPKRVVWAYRAGVFFCCVLVFLPQVVSDIDMTVRMNRRDSRTIAGEAILEMVPKGARVAVTEEPWQFEMPPMDASRYEIVVCGYDAEALAASRPNAFVYSELQSDPEVNPHEAAFWRTLEAQVSAARWRVVYESDPGCDCYKFYPALALWKTPPEDMRFVSPRITVLVPSENAPSGP